MKVLFLDVDGVLNTLDSPGVLNVNQRRTKLLRQVVESTNCGIVVSSTWRQQDQTRRRLESKLRYKGLKVLDYTSSDNTMTRGEQVAEWLSRHPVERYAIVDDINSFLDKQQVFFVQTDPYEGLTQKHVDELVRILNGV